MTETTAGTNRRQHERKETELRGTLLVNGSSVACDVLDISAGGGRLRSVEPLDHDGALTLRIEGFGEFPGDIAWKRGQSLGMRFRDDPEKVAEVLTAILVYQGS